MSFCLRQGFRLRAYERFAETSRRDRLQAMGGGGAYSLPSLGGVLGLRVGYFPAARQRGCGSEDSRDEGLY